MVKVLAITKQRTGYGGYTSGLSSGLLTSSQMCVDMLNASGVSAKLVDVVDNNDIDRKVSTYRPKFVILEALWVVPEKFDVLAKLHPSVQWIVRVHSELPFLATEGIAVEWITRYLHHPNVVVAGNSKESVAQIRALVAAVCPKLDDWEIANKVWSLINYYPVGKVQVTRHPESRFMDIGCFGATRPLKNQLIQAAAAIRCADRMGKILRFHVNSTRVEQGGDPVLKNLRALFDHHRHSLVEHDWVSHPEFLKLLKKMNASMCVSLSETFCIVAADTVASGVPLLASNEVPWVYEGSTADPKCLESIAAGLRHVMDYDFGRKALEHNIALLTQYAHVAKQGWLGYFA